MAARAGRPPQPGDVKALLVRQLAAASRLLHGKRPITDEVVHDARKMLKRARASLRLLRAIIGDDAYHTENARIRDAAKPLSRMRDAKVILETVNDLGARRPGRRARRELKRIEEPFRVDRRDVRREFLRSRTPAELLRALHAAQWHAERLHLSDSADGSLAAGLARVYRLGRDALTRADAVASDDALHESRKQAKYLAQGMKVFEPIEARWIGKTREARKVDCQRSRSRSRSRGAGRADYHRLPGSEPGAGSTFRSHRAPQVRTSPQGAKEGQKAVSPEGARFPAPPGEGLLWSRRTGLENSCRTRLPDRAFRLELAIPVMKPGLSHTCCGRRMHRRRRSTHCARACIPVRAAITRACPNCLYPRPCEWMVTLAFTGHVHVFEMTFAARISSRNRNLILTRRLCRATGRSTSGSGRSKVGYRRLLALPIPISAISSASTPTGRREKTAGPPGRYGADCGRTTFTLAVLTRRFGFAASSSSSRSLMALRANGPGTVCPASHRRTVDQAQESSRHRVSRVSPTCRTRWMMRAQTAESDSSIFCMCAIVCDRARCSVSRTSEGSSTRDAAPRPESLSFRFERSHDRPFSPLPPRGFC